MGKVDASINPWLEDERRFADLFNGLLFRGKQVIKYKDLQRITPVVVHTVKDKSGKRQSVKRYRDVAMMWRNVKLSVLALESQNKVDYQMPVRTMLYDALSYARQTKEKWKNISLGERRKLTGGEYLSRFRAKDKLAPIITMVIYYGEEGEWDGPKSLYDMLDICEDESVREVMESLIPDYRINLVELQQIDDLQMFITDLQIMFGVVKYKRDDEALLKYIDDNSDYFNDMEDDAADAMLALLNDNGQLAERIEEAKRLRDSEFSKEGISVCKALRDMVEKGEARGEVRGEMRGEVKGMIKLGKSLNVDRDDMIERLKNMLNLSEEKAKEYMIMYW